MVVFGDNNIPYHFTAASVSAPLQPHADNWQDRSTFQCSTCMWFVSKADPGSISTIGRCRKHAPTMNGYPVTYTTDWCGDHKLRS